jgi:amino acid adenylation domain-containing protein
MHHIVSDGWSLPILFRELRVLYEAFAAGRPSPLEELPVQYADFAAWQRAWLAGEVLDAHLAYWKAELAGAPHLIELPRDRPRPARQSFRGAVQHFTFPPGLGAGLEALGQAEGATLFMTVLAGFLSLLHRYTEQDTILVGSPIANRSHREVEDLVGFFVNTLVLRGDFADRPTFRELLRRVRGTALGAFAHQDLPFERLVEEIHPERSLGHHPLFQVMFALEAGDRDGSAPPAPAGAQPGTAKFDLTLTVTTAKAGWSGALAYATDLFDDATIARLGQHLVTLLAGAAARPDTPIPDLPLLGPEERRQVLVSWNDTAVPLPEATLPELFAAQAARTPDAIAVEIDGASLRYGELLARAHRLAHLLRARGVGPDAAVGLMAPRSLEMVVGVLGILAAGGAYVPLDPAYPHDRLLFMLEAAGVGVLLADATSAAALPDLAATVVPLDADLGAFPASPPPLQAGPESLAYVIFTSGSTGRPKGVTIPHRAIVNHMGWMLGAFPLDGSDTVLQRTPTSFDASVWEIFAPLLSGARMVLAPPFAHADSAAIVRLAADRGVTVMQCVPALLDAIVAEPGLAACRSLRRVFVGGEALPAALARRFRARSGAELWNLYGPTETAVDATFHRCQDDDLPRGIVPIGRPIANCRVHVLDRHLEPVPAGVPGEIYIGGRAVGP